ncbi:hypothetical protein [Spirulina sp. 06S082]|uniref:hypothetical protein n=1 Tax=Spirulina sp. 06S082 TaxID=3110248 RepID=UPI002B20429C|nr:hypothetical protein [Spirulina sp. 06S082]MEA5469834.1 hypothetical protein [Spirulina sp. 06S082]
MHDKSSNLYRSQTASDRMRQNNEQVSIAFSMRRSLHHTKQLKSTDALNPA